ncbi:hypothetical protein [Actinoplanes sp. NPDC049802]|uniref:hypothetical protein n=1 Tax=Actinoplanes sp. NPDC049802 TaxID=3154742 RepID=UPI0033D526DB
MQAALVLAGAGAFLYFTWSSFLLRVRLLLAPEPVGAARQVSALGLWLTFFGGATALLDMALHRPVLPFAVTVAMALGGVACYWYASRVDVQLIRAREHARVNAAPEVADGDRGDGLPDEGSAGGSGEVAAEVRDPQSATAYVSVFAVLSTLVFWCCLFAAWQFGKYGGGWPVWVAAATAVIGPWGYRRAHHPDSTPLPALVFAASLPVTVILVVTAVLRIPPQ